MKYPTSPRAVAPWITFAFFFASSRYALILSNAFLSMTAPRNVRKSRDVAHLHVAHHADDAVAYVWPERLRNVNAARRGALLSLILESAPRNGDRNLLRVRRWVRDDEILAARFADDARIRPVAAGVLADLSPHAVEDRRAAR